jgi:hypothetical protein
VNEAAREGGCLERLVCPFRPNSTWIATTGLPVQVQHRDDVGMHEQRGNDERVQRMWLPL